MTKMYSGGTNALTDHLVGRLVYSVAIFTPKMYSGGIRALSDHLVERVDYSLIIS